MHEDLISGLEPFVRAIEPVEAGLMEDLIDVIDQISETDFEDSDRVIFVLNKHEAHVLCPVVERVRYWEGRVTLDYIIASWQIIEFLLSDRADFITVIYSKKDGIHSISKEECLDLLDPEHLETPIRLIALKDKLTGICQSDRLFRNEGLEFPTKWHEVYCAIYVKTLLGFGEL